MLAAVYWARASRVVLPDRALCLPTFCLLLTVNKSSSSVGYFPSILLVSNSRLKCCKQACRDKEAREW